MRTLHSILVLVTAFGSSFGIRALHAQTVGDQLPVTGSVIYHGLFHNIGYGTETFRIGLRFGGRIAVRVAPGTFVGFGGGSWATLTRGACDLPDCDGYLGSQSEAYVYQLYLQQYVSGTRLFVRGSAGLAETRTLFPETRILIAVTDRWRGALGVGGGIDFPIAPHLYLTPSLDFTVLPGADTGAEELGSALAIGVAITLR
jgi:hypothetical protein